MGAIFSSSSQLCFTVFLASLLKLIPWVDCSHHHQDYSYPKALFVFGDSIFDPGNNNYINTTTDFQANFSPYGESFFKYPTGRFSNGRLIPDFIAEYAMLQLIPPFRQTSNHQLAHYGMNFASGGSGALAETSKGLAIDLSMQLRYFKNTVARQLRSKLGKKEAKVLLSNAVYLFSVGSNDYLFPFATNSSVIKVYGPREYAKQVVGNFTAVIKEIYKEGGRKFGFLNLGPLGCLPSVKVNTNGGACAEEITALAKLHNLMFSKKMKEMEEKLLGFDDRYYYSIFDFAAATEEMAIASSKYGFKEVNSACCGSGPFRGMNSCGRKRNIIRGEILKEYFEFQVCENADEYLFFDANHPTEAAYRHFAKLMWNGNRNLTAPYNLKSLFQLTL